MAGFKRFFTRKKQYDPRDSSSYTVTQDVIDFTVDVLREYGAKKMSEEGLVYWAGNGNGGNFEITAAVAPKTEATRYGFKTSNTSNARFVEFICDNDLLYIAQVHSHPGTMVDHSIVDNEETAFRSEGLISIVVPVFGRKGMLPLTVCGIHRFAAGKFPRLGNRYIRRHFNIIKVNNNPSLLKDLRYE
jgi:hypothetical protein